MLHVATVVVMASLALVAPLGPVYLAGVAVVARAARLRAVAGLGRRPVEVRAEAFDLNGYVGILYLITTAVSLYVD